jgi:hypothetical protein
MDVGKDYESVAKFWISNKKHLIANIMTSAVLWSLWNLRNDICFQGVCWLGLKMVLSRITRMLRRWLPMYKLEIGGLLEEAISKLVELSRQPARIEWKEEITRSSSQSGLLGVQSLVAIGARNENSQAFETL